MPQRQITRVCATREVHLCWSIVERAEQLGTSGIATMLISSAAVITDESMDAMTGRAGVIDYSVDHQVDHHLHDDFKLLP